MVPVVNKVGISSILSTIRSHDIVAVITVEVLVMVVALVLFR
jgi:hypothetical protein